MNTSKITKRGSTMFLKGVLFIMGLTVLGLCGSVIYLATQADMGAYTPILGGMCFAAIPFFVALYQAFKLLTYIDQNKAFSQLSLDALKKIKLSASIIGGLYTLGMPYIFMVAQEDDAPGAVAMALAIIFASVVVAVFAAVLEKLMANGLELKSENDLTV